MSVKINYASPEWWAWTLTLIALLMGLAGDPSGFYVVGALSLGQAIWFSSSPDPIQSQVRFVYLALALLGYFDPTKLVYIVLTLGTFAVVLFDRCMITQALAKAPWNARSVPA